MTTQRPDTVPSKQSVDALAAKLADNLQRTALAYRQVLDVEQLKQERIVASDARGILQCVEEARPLTGEIKRLERDRQALQGRLGRQLGLEDRPTIRAIADHVRGGASEQLRELRDQLIGTLGELSKVHQSNAFLVTRSLEVLDQVLGAVFDHLRQGTTYERSGSRQRSGADSTVLSETM